MLNLTCTPLRIKTRNVLHLVHPKMLKTPEVQSAQAAVQAGAAQIVTLGQTMLSPARFNSYDTYILHTVTQDLLPDLVHRLEHDGYKERFQKLKEHPSKMLLCYDNAIQALCSKLTVIPTDQLTVFNRLWKTQNVSLDQPGLGILPFRVDTHAEHIVNNRRYLDIAYQITQDQPLYVFDSRVMYDFVPNRKPALMLKNGEMFKVYKNDIKSVKNIEEVITHTSPDIQKQHEQNKMQRSDTQQVQKS